MGKVTIPGFEPDTFNLFLQYMFYGRYTLHESDPLEDGPVLDTVKAWVLGDYLLAVDFQNYAMRCLYPLLLPDDGIKCQVCIGPEIVNFCCSNCPPGSPLVELVSDFLIKYWHSGARIDYDSNNYEQWDTIWDENPAFRNNILCETSQTFNVRARAPQNIEEYLITA